MPHFPVLPLIARAKPPLAAFAAGLSFALLSGPALAQTAAETPGPSSSAILQMLFGLVLIIGLLFAGTYLLRRLGGGRNFGNAGPMKVVGGLMISPRERILLVEVGDDWLVVGVVPGQIKTLHRLPKGELPAGGADGKPFGQWLKQIAERTDGQR